MTAKTAVICFSLMRKSFDSLLGPIQDVWRFEALRKVPILFSLSNSQLFDLARCMKYHTLQAGQVVFKKGEPGLLFKSPGQKLKFEATQQKSMFA